MNPPARPAAAGRAGRRQNRGGRRRTPAPRRWKGNWWPDWRAHVSELIAAVARPRIETVKELTALPAGTLIDRDGKVYRRREYCDWWQSIVGKPFNYAPERMVPAVVLWTPDASR